MSIDSENKTGFRYHRHPLLASQTQPLAKTKVYVVGIALARAAKVRQASSLSLRLIATGTKQDRLEACRTYQLTFLRVCLTRLFQPERQHPTNQHAGNHH